MLRAELAERQERRTSYSTRAFARDLGLSAAYLTLLLQGKRRLALKRAQELLRHTRWPKAKRRLFLGLIQVEAAVDPAARRDALAEVAEAAAGQKEHPALPLDTFRLISQWHHSAILELVETAGFDGEPLAIARRLGISPAQADVSVARLIRLGLLTQTPQGLVKTNATVEVGSVPSKAIRTHHREMLELAQRALDEQSFDQREVSGMITAIDPKLLPELKAKMTQFRKEVLELAQSGDRTAVYRLSLQLFRLDRA